MQQHASGKPAINKELCRGCHRCSKECGSDAITYENKKAVIDYDKCKGCGRCIGACSFDAVYNPNSSANELLDRKMAEYAQAVCHGRPCFHISLVQDISPNCDCHGENDAPILPDIGMFASFDPVALDQNQLKTVSLENIFHRKTGIAITTTLKIPIRILSGKRHWIRQKKLVWEAENMN